MCDDEWKLDAREREETQQADRQVDHTQDKERRFGHRLDVPVGSNHSSLVVVVYVSVTHKTKERAPIRPPARCTC